MSDGTGHWLNDLSLGKYLDVLVENEVDLDATRELPDAELRQLGISMGPRNKLLRDIAELGDATPSISAAEPIDDQSAPSATAEGRQQSVMFCDLIGSTELSRRSAPEDLRELMRRYWDSVAGGVTRYGGHVAKYPGASILGYLSWVLRFLCFQDQARKRGYEAIALARQLDPSFTIAQTKMYYSIGLVGARDWSTVKTLRDQLS